MLIRFFQWGPQKIGGASTTNGPDSTADCYCDGDPTQFCNWDVSIYMDRTIISKEDPSYHRLENALKTKLATLAYIMINL